MRKISSRSSKVKPSPQRRLIAKADELVKSGRVVYNYTAGQPGLPPDEDLIKEFYGRLTKDPFNHFRYVPTAGLIELREAIREDLRKYGGFDVDVGNIVVTSGGVEGMNLSLIVTTDPGDEVVLLDPTYSVYWDLAEFYGLKVRKCVQDVSNGFQPDEECLKSAISRKTAAVIVVSPDNPTSRIVREDLMKLIADLCIDNDVWLIYDEAYKHVVYEGEHVWIQRHSRTMEKLISINSFSKDIAIPGFRLGYTYAPKEVVAEITKVKGFLSITSPVPGQWFAYYALTTGIKERYLGKVLPIYRSRRDALYDALRKHLPEAKVWKPQASMYLFPDLTPYIQRIGMSDVDFTYQLADRKAVVMLPGSIFGEHGNNHLRITFVTQPEEKLRKGVELMAEFIEEEAGRKR
ncbi:MAG: pyridoxal phosphate-dependent aminotransferase [Zestosphaera sp.]